MKCTNKKCLFKSSILNSGCINYSNPDKNCTFFEPEIKKEKSPLNWNWEDYLNFVITIIICQSPMWLSLIMGYKTGSKYYNWTIITMIIFFGILIFKNRFDIEKLQKEVRELKKEK